jgi:hypothetical protein
VSDECTACGYVLTWAAREGISFSNSFIRALTSLMRATSLLKATPKALLLKTVTVQIKFQHRKLGKITFKPQQYLMWVYHVKKSLD